MATYTNLDNEIFYQGALQGYVAALMPFSAFSTDFSPNPAQKGNNVLVPLVASLTATTFGGSYAVCGGAMSVITVNISQHKIVHLGQNDLTAHSSSFARLEEFGYQQGMALGLMVIQDVWSLLTTANFGLATAVSVVDFGLAQIRRSRYLLNDANVPLTPRSLVLDLDPYDNLLGISNFLQANLANTDQTLRQGRTGQIFGMGTYETNALPGTGSVMGFAAHASAIAIAMRYLQPQAGHKYDMAMPVTDPDTGATFGVRSHYDENTGTKYLNLEANYGYSVGISNGARVIKRLD